MVQTPDYVVELCPPKCSCGTSLLGQKKKPGSIRQVFDLPAPSLEVTEYQQQSCVCPNCGKRNSRNDNRGEQVIHNGLLHLPYLGFSLRVLFDLLDSLSFSSAELVSFSNHR